MATANAALFRLADRYLTMRLRELPEPEHGFTARVRLAVQQALAEGRCSQQTIAGFLGCQSRTLQRRLADEGTTLRAVVDEVRKARARALLESKMSVAEVSYVLGYSDPAAFQHAFRRWYGMRPKAWRARREGRGTRRSTPGRAAPGRRHVDRAFLQPVGAMR
jgi:AraC-like DNA-binding protein